MLIAARPLALPALALLLAACVYVPVVNEPDAASANCKTFTQSMSLDAIEVGENMSHGGCHNGDCAALLAGAAVVSAGSAIISGSIVLTGNTIHWLEYQGTCSNGYLSKTRQVFLEALGQVPAGSATHK